MTEVEFRTGPRLVPDHVAAMMEGFETYRLTYEEAMRLANQKLVADRFGQTVSGMIREHFAEGREPWRR